MDTNTRIVMGTKNGNQGEIGTNGSRKKPRKGFERRTRTGKMR